MPRISCRLTLAYDDILAEGGIFGRCRRYNDAPDQLRLATGGAAPALHLVPRLAGGVRARRAITARRGDRLPAGEAQGRAPFLRSSV